MLADLVPRPAGTGYSNTVRGLRHVVDSACTAVTAPVLGALTGNSQLDITTYINCPDYNNKQDLTEHDTREANIVRHTNNQSHGAIIIKADMEQKKVVSDVIVAATDTIQRAAN
uniref:SFRICE_020297 n=1 Tax=Spodoptera frugiperda TaxID=7108 RepID=A0A2H1WEF3_SPOFR